MKKLIYPIAFLLAFAVPTFAQQQEITLKVNGDEINMIGKALGKLPYDDVAALIQNLRTQITNQQQPKADAPAVVPVPPVK